MMQMKAWWEERRWRLSGATSRGERGCALLAADWALRWRLLDDGVAGSGRQACSSYGVKDVLLGGGGWRGRQKPKG